FIHEMSHVWQTAQGVNVIATGFGLHMTKGTASYQYDVHQETVFGAQSIEQQAKIVENYFLWEQYLLSTEGQGRESLDVSRETACDTYLLHHAAAVQALPLPPALKACLK